MSKHTRQFEYNGERFEVPVLGQGADPGTVRVDGQDLRGCLGAAPTTTLVGVDQDTHEHKIIPSQGQTELNEGARLTSVERHVNAGRGPEPARVVSYPRFTRAPAGSGLAWETHEALD